MAKIQNILQQLVPIGISYYDAVVVSVDENERTCVVNIVNGEYDGDLTCRLMASVDDGVLVIPEVDTNVIICMDSKKIPYIAQYSGVEKIILRGGQYDGLVKVNELKTKLNNIENLFNNLVTLFNTHTHPVVVSVGSGSTTPTTSQQTQTLTPTQKADIENNKITHG